MKNLYLEMKERQQNEVNNLPIYFAFGDRQLQERANELGFESVDEMIKNVTGIGAGGFVKNEDFDRVMNAFKEHDEEMTRAFESDDFLKSAFEYELANHEYIITYDKGDTLRALGISFEEYQKSERMQKLMAEAVTNYLKAMNELGW